MERETREPQGGEASWYYLRGDETIGPLPAAELRGLFRAGKLGPETLVWRAGMKDWVPASSLGVTAATTPAPPPPPGQRAAQVGPRLSNCPIRKRIAAPPVGSPRAAAWRRSGGCRYWPSSCWLWSPSCSPRWRWSC